MTITSVLSVRELRAGLATVFAELRHGGAPVVVGTHRKPEVVLMSVTDYETLADGLGEKASRRARGLASDAASVLAELPGQFSPEAEADAAAYVRGEIDTHELAGRAAARYRERAAVRAR